MAQVAKFRVQFGETFVGGVDDLTFYLQDPPFFVFQFLFVFMKCLATTFDECAMEFNLAKFVWVHKK